ncbi:hypothetical protein GCM10012275_56410 [Longimycelium tulufanense]|uniref:Peptidoglycan binding-like domain-containing protein n=1 Tax=Longimycelium tulufanense TaxID=907463 RepID=A0A8J3CI07_9PSEU|nr:hypothetical protein GCM10012275_56410 [Longimycelium tulufanense]
MTGPHLIRHLQVAINLTGLTRVPVDGVLGPITTIALRRVQRHHNLPVTGEPDRTTLRALGVEESPC